MDAYKAPGDFRRALEDRLKARAADQTQLTRLRLMVVSDRMLARLEHDAPGRWIVKGGTALEIRLPGRARRTKDLDMATREDVADGEEVKRDLEDALREDPFGDWFVFRVSEPQPLADDEKGRPAWRFTIECLLAERTFSRVRVDVVARHEEISQTERATVTEILSFSGLPPVEVEVVQAPQHFAEKLHAYTKSYGERPNTRVRDLVDMILLIENGLAPDAQQFALVEHVFAVRGTHPVPLQFPDPSSNWEGTYQQLVEDLDVRARTLNEAVEAARQFWTKTVEAGRKPTHD